MEHRCSMMLSCPCVLGDAGVLSSGLLLIQELNVDLALLNPPPRPIDLAPPRGTPGIVIPEMYV